MCVRDPSIYYEGPPIPFLWLQVAFLIRRCVRRAGVVLLAVLRDLLGDVGV